MGNLGYFVLYFILWVVSWFVGFAGAFLNLVIQTTVISMSANINNIAAIDIGWAAIRDLVNIGFIFILLYIAIGTILGLDEHGTKSALVKLILIAVLINFSMFFTKIIIDASNILAIEFYSKINIPANSGGIGTSIMGAFHLTSVYNSGSAIENAANFAGNSPLTTFIMGIIFMVTAICVLLAACLIFIKRFVTILFLIMSAPVGFAGMILHSTEHFASEWWKKLIAEALAAPVFMIILWLVFAIIQDPGFFNANQSSNSLASSISSLGQGNGGGASVGILLNAVVGGDVILNFAIVTALLSFALIAVEHLGASGGEAAVHAFGSLKAGATDLLVNRPGSALFRNTIGKGAYNLLEKDHTFRKSLDTRRDQGGLLTRTWAQFQYNTLHGLAAKEIKLAGEGGHGHAGGGHGVGERSYSGELEERTKVAGEVKAEEKSLANNANVIAKGLQGAVTNQNRQLRERQLEAEGTSGAAEIFALYAQEIKDANTTLAKPPPLPTATAAEKEAYNNEMTKAQGNKKFYQTALDNGLNRFSTTDKGVIERKMEGSLEFDRLQMETLINKIQKAVTPAEKSDAAEKARAYVGDLNVAKRVGLDMKQLMVTPEGKIATQPNDPLLFKDYFDPQILDKIERGQKADDNQKVLIGKIMSEQADRYQLFEMAKKTGNDPEIVHALSKEMEKLTDIQDAIVAAGYANLGAIDGAHDTATYNLIMDRYEKEHGSEESKMANYAENNGKRNYDETVERKENKRLLEEKDPKNKKKP